MALAPGAIALLIGGTAYGSAAWDAGLHAVMLGFVFSMVFGHAPIIVPAVTRAAVPYHWSFYLPLALLHLSLVLIVGFRLAGMAEWRQAGAANALAFAGAGITKTYDVDQYSRYGTILVLSPAQDWEGFVPAPILVQSVFISRGIFEKNRKRGRIRPALATSQ